MSERSRSPIKTWLLGAAAGALILGGNLVVAPSPASADDASARRVLKGMSDYMASQRNLSARFQVALDIVTPSIQTIQFVGSGELQLSRPGNLHVRRTGGYTDVELFYNGETATIVNRDGNSYAQLASAGTFDQLIDRLQSEYNIQMPGADLLLGNVYDALNRDAVTAIHVGQGMVNGWECEHLAFRNADVDWQIWVRTGGRPLPCRYVITSKTVAGGPEYEVQFLEWGTAARPNSAYTYRPGRDARLVQFRDLADIGELPRPAPFSGGDQ